MSDNPIDVVILWVDGNDPKLAEKRNRYLKDEKKSSSHPGALPTRFASKNEIRYCVLSILTFAPFVRNIFIVTDGQDPNIYEDVKKWFPEKSDSLKIVDHTEIFKGYEQFLPSFNSSSIHSLIWKIDGLSENFVYFNDDVFLIRKIEPEDWFINNRPVLRGKWLLAPYKKILSDYIKVLINRNLKNKPDYQPRISFYIRQWKAAMLAGMKFRYFFHCHTPHPLTISRLEGYFFENKKLLEKNISFRFRDQDQFLVTALSNHLEILDGNKQFAKLNLGYLHPYYSDKRLNKKIRKCENDPDIKSVCAQSIDMLGKKKEEEIFNWMDSVLGLREQK